jgi:hypothetical protein
MIVAPSRIEPPDFFKTATPYERRGLKNHVVAVAKCVFQIPCLGYEIAMNASKFVDDGGGPVYNVNAWLSFEDLDDRSDGTRLPEVVCV